MYKRIFLDANVIADLFDNTRVFHQHSKEVLLFLAEDTAVELFTSCDIVTTLYYILAKRDKQKALDAILQINELCSVVEFSNAEILQSCKLMQTDKTYKDLEDTIQYVMAKKINAGLILTNDKGFVSEDIKIINSENFHKKYVQK